MEQAKAMQASWASSSVAGALAVWMTGNQNPKDLAMGMVAGLVPMLARWANPNDSAWLTKNERRRMDGCWWSCYCNTGSHLFVSESDCSLDYERTFTEFGFEPQGSSDQNRSSLGLSIHQAHRFRS
jgi:hypothetical protein